MSASILLVAALQAISASPALSTPDIYVWTNFVGQPGGYGNADGTGSAARFYNPNGVVVDTDNTIYVADTDNHVIRRMTPTGKVTTLAGLAETPGSNDGTGSVARFQYPRAVALDSAGNLYVADSSNHTIRRLTPAGTVTTLAGLAGTPGSTDGTGNAARFDFPYGVALDSAGNVYVADQLNCTIRKVTQAGVVTTLAGLVNSPGTNDGTGSAARFNYPDAVATDSAGNVYVADASSHTIRKVTPAGVVTTLAGLAKTSGSTDGTGSAAKFNNPGGMTVDSGGNVYVADANSHTIRKVTPAGVVTTLAGLAGTSGSTDGTGSAGRFNHPQGVGVDIAGNVYVADRFNHTIRQVTATGVVTTLAGLAPASGSSDGAGNEARFSNARGMTADSVGNLYVADTWNHTIRKVTPAAVVTTLAGLAGVSGSSDGAGSAAQFYRPSGVAVGSAGNLFVADWFNNTIRKVTPDGIVTTLAGLAGTSGTSDGTGGAARFYHPYGVAADSVGNVYATDCNNCTIRKVTSGGVVTTLAGLAGASGSTDGTGSGARFNYPYAVAADGVGNVYVADSANNTIRKVTPAGVVTTLAGLAKSSGSSDGMGSEARFYNPSGVAVDSENNVYVADTFNYTIRKVTANGVVTTIGGAPGIAGGVDGVGTSANFSYPSAVAVGTNGSLYVADAYNNRISKGTPHVTGDISGDGYVNVPDLQALVTAWGSHGDGTPSSNWNLAADLNIDGYVNVGDLQMLVANWGRSMY